MAASPSSFHIAMYPWLAYGHLIPFLHLANKLAQKGHKISFLAPTKTQHKLQPFNHHHISSPSSPSNYPKSDGLPSGAETTSDVPSSLGPPLATAMDRTKKTIEDLLRDLKVDLVFFDFSYLIPEMARRLHIKSIHYNIISAATIGYTMSPERMLLGREITETDLMKPPRNYPDLSIQLQPHEARLFAARRVMEFGDRVSFCDRQFTGISQADVIV